MIVNETATDSQPQHKYPPKNSITFLAEDKGI